MESANQSVFQPLDASARRLVRQLLTESRHAALATLEHGTGFPLSTRVGLACTLQGSPVLLLSELAAHTQALLSDPRCSLLCGEPGSANPLTYPRITLFARACRHAKDDPHLEPLKAIYLSAHPSASRYADFGDFAFWSLNIERASLNAGFGRAYQLDDKAVLGCLGASSV